MTRRIAGRAGPRPEATTAHQISPPTQTSRQCLHPCLIRVEGIGTSMTDIQTGSRLLRLDSNWSDPKPYLSVQRHSCPSVSLSGCSYPLHSIETRTQTMELAERDRARRCVSTIIIKQMTDADGFFHAAESTDQAV